MKYRWDIDGTAANDQTWSATGHVEIDIPDAFGEAPGQALQEAYEQLTTGKVNYGQPGEGCHPPYAVTRMLIEQVE